MSLQVLGGVVGEHNEDSGQLRMFAPDVKPGWLRPHLSLTVEKKLDDDHGRLRVLELLREMHKEVLNEFSACIPTDECHIMSDSNVTLR